jgi:hypothetical protein
LLARRSSVLLAASTSTRMRASPSATGRRAAATALLGCGAFLAIAAFAATVIDQGLAIQRTGANQYTVSWNAFLSQGLVLQSSPSLTSPGWGDVGGSPTTVGNRRQMVINAAVPPVFYRVACQAFLGDDEPDDNFDDTNCDGVDGNVQAAIFVSPTGNDANPGTPQQPALTIAAGMSKAEAAGRNQVYVAAGDYVMPTLNPSPSMIIVGGYNPNDWTRSDANVTRILSTSSTAVFIENFQVILDHLTIVSANATSGSSYGVRVLGQGGGSFLFSAFLHKCVIQSGNGAVGVNGTNGIAGANGGNGGDGAPACSNCPVFNESPCPPGGPFRGNAGTGSATCGSLHGGLGGVPGVDPTSTASNGHDGGTSVGGNCGDLNGCGGQGGTSGHPNGRNGFGAPDGSAGTSGPAGSASFTTTGYAIAGGGNGTNGGNGLGGGGGGGGKGGSNASFPGCTTYGGAGGGGGAAGCGGTAGTGGTSGGGSFGIYVGSAYVIVDQCSITTGNAGNGGSGGVRGLGGTRGLGGSGGAGYAVNSGVSSGSGGHGAPGSNGGNGGHGGGGGGGSSVGLAYSSDSNIGGTPPAYTIGTGGNGGASNGNSGPIGLSSTVIVY